MYIMFDLELISLLNSYKHAQNDYERAKVKSSITNLIMQDRGGLEKFAQKHALDKDTEDLINSCLADEKSLEAEATKKEEVNDVSALKNYYSRWQTEYVNNNRVANEACEAIVLEIINFYVINRFEVLLKMLDMNDSVDFEAFKFMIKNYLRKYFGEKIESYYNSERFESLGFFEKRRKDKEIAVVLADIAKYKFDKKKIEEVIE